MYKRTSVIGLIGLMLAVLLVSCANKSGSDAQIKDMQKQLEDLKQQVGQTQQQTIPAGQVVPQQAIPQQAIPQQVVPQQTIPQQVVPQQTIPQQQTLPPLTDPLYSGPGAMPQSTEITLEQAKQIAVNDIGVEITSAAFTKLSPDYDNGFMHWDIHFVAGNMKYEYEISSIDGSILKKEVEVVAQGGFPQEAKAYQQGLSVDPTGQPGVGVDVERAKQIAVQHAGVNMSAVVFVKLEHDVERRTPQWEIEFVIGNLKYEYEINAMNGAILKFKTKKFTMD